MLKAWGEALLDGFRVDPELFQQSAMLVGINLVG